MLRTQERRKSHPLYPSDTLTSTTLEEPHVVTYCTNTLKVAAPLVGTALALSACGGGDETETAAPAPAATVNGISTTYNATAEAFIKDMSPHHSSAVGMSMGASLSTGDDVAALKPLNGAAFDGQLLTKMIAHHERALERTAPELAERREPPGRGARAGDRRHADARGRGDGGAARNVVSTAREGAERADCLMAAALMAFTVSETVSSARA